MTQTSKTIKPPLDSTRVHLLVATLSVIALAIAFFRAPEPTEPASSNSIRSFSIDLNQAPPRELALLPGVGPVLAKRIAENRDRLGPFGSTDDVGRVHGVGDKTIALFAEYVTVDPRNAEPIRISLRE